MATIIGRKKEIAELNELYESDRAQFVAVYGRRRIGKTFLIDEALKDRITFRHAGMSPINDLGERNMIKEQLHNFFFSLQTHGWKEKEEPASWTEAFVMLEKLLMSMKGQGRQVVFMDEMPWMDTPRSNFISALEYFWNSWGCHRDNLMLIVCGSATSWILNNLINNHGGLYGRVTHEICLSPFTLSECEEYYEAKGIRMSRYDIVQAYMILGGVPFYLDYLRKDNSLAQNIDELFFSKKAKLRDELQRLLSSVFSNPEEMKKIITLLSTKRAGFTRKAISEKLGITTGKGLTEMLKALIASDFVIKYVPFGMSKRDIHYKLIDPFCKFYLKFVEGHDTLDTEFWSNNQTSQSIISWRGLAFEDVCLNHIDKIKAALGISGVITTQSAWAIEGDDDKQGTQIDLLINRRDNVVNMCEMKFYSDEFEVNEGYYRTIYRRIDTLMRQLPKRTSIHSTLITTYGLKYGKYSGCFIKVVTIDDLFK